jgi:uncharacterized protein YihD (DUF1040 family)
MSRDQCGPEVLDTLDSNCVSVNEVINSLHSTWQKQSHVMLVINQIKQNLT